MRTILVHLNVEVPDEDERGPVEFADEIVGSLAQDPDLIRCDISAPLAEEVSS